MSLMIYCLPPELCNNGTFELFPINSSTSNYYPTTTATLNLLPHNDTPATTDDVPCTSRPNVRVSSPFLVTVKGLMMTLIMVAAILGNLLVIVSVLRFERLRLLANAFIVSLAFTDLLVACLVMPFSASKELADRWLRGQVACDVFNANDVLFSTASLLHLCCISVDRYVAVTDPLRYEERLTRRRVGLMLGSVWVASIVISHLPIHTGWYTTEAHRCVMRGPDGDTQCNFEVNQYYGVISSTVSFWIPAIVMLFTYQKIYDEATKQEKYIQSMTALSSRETSTDRLQYQCVDEAVLQRTPPKDPYVGRRVYACRSLGPSIERNLHSGSIDRNIGRNNAERIQNSGSVDGNLGRNNAERNPNSGSVDGNLGGNDGERKLDLGLNPNVRNSVTGSLDRILLDRNPNRNNPVDRTSCDGHMDGNPSRTSLDRQLNQNLNRSLDGGLDRTLGPSLDRISLDRKLYRNLILHGTSYDRHLDRNHQAVQHRRKMRREHKAAKTLGVIMGAFLFCWLPFFTMYLTNALCGDACYIPHSVESILFWVGYLNSALNPVIYALFNRDFRDAFRRLLSCGVRRSACPIVTTGGGPSSIDHRKTMTVSQDRISMR